MVIDVNFKKTLKVICLLVKISSLPMKNKHQIFWIGFINVSPDDDSFGIFIHVKKEHDSYLTDSIFNSVGMEMCSIVESYLPDETVGIADLNS